MDQFAKFGLYVADNSNPMYSELVSYKNRDVLISFNLVEDLALCNLR
jgi:hypothetical protein